MKQQGDELPMLNLDFEHNFKFINKSNSSNSISISNQEDEKDDGKNPVLQQSKFKRWKQKEQYEYFLFVHHHYDKLKDKNARLPFRIFKLMSKFIASRSCDQCRSHHQKMARVGISLRQKLNSFKNKHCNFHIQYGNVRQVLIHQQDADFYLNCDICSTENQNKYISENGQNHEQKLSPATTVDRQEAKSKMESLNSLQYLSKLKSLMFFYDKWRQLVVQLIQSQQICLQKNKAPYDNLQLKVEKREKQCSQAQIFQFRQPEDINSVSKLNKNIPTIIENAMKQG